jgi:methionyl-tRNA formyltransferase
VSRELRTVALLGRQPGLLVLEHALLGQPDVDVVAVFTHGRLPAAEGAGVRPELERFQRLCDTAGVPLHTVDTPAANNIAELLPGCPLDLLVSLSWRYLVPPQVLDRFAYGAVNVHRGALPAYAGARPVQRALEAGERRVAVTAHQMVAEIDAGERIAEVWLDVRPLQAGEDAAARAEDVKRLLEPLYAPLVRLVVQTRALGTGV